MNISSLYVRWAPVVALVTALAVPSPWDLMAAPPDSSVTIYQDWNYQGASQSLAPGWYDWGDLKIGNDTLSSLRVPAGWRVTLYEHDKFYGATRVYTGDAANVGDFNDRTSAVLVERQPPSGTTTVAIYPESNYQGVPQSLRPGWYDIGSLRIGNDALSSLRVPKGWRVTLYEDAPWTGRSRVFGEDASSLGDFNDRSSGVSVERPPSSDPAHAAVIYTDRNYRGAAQQLQPGRYDMGALRIGNDALSSLQVPDGWRVTLYEHGPGNGRARAFTGAAASVGDDFDDRTSQVLVERVTPTEGLRGAWHFDKAGTQECTIRVKADGRELHAHDLGDYMISTRYQTGDDYTRMHLIPQTDGSFRIRVKASGRYWHAHDLGDYMISTRYQTDDAYSKFFLEQDGDAYRLRVNASRRTLHANDLGDQLISTRYQVDDDYARFTFTCTAAGAPIEGPDPGALLKEDAQWTARGVFDGGVALDGVRAHVDLGRPILDTANSYTVSAWVNLNRVTGDSQTVVAQDSANSSPFSLQWRQDIGRFAFAVHDKQDYNVRAQVGAAEAPKAKTWYHLVGVHDSASRKIRFYLDGKLQGEADWNLAWTATGNTVVGRARFGGFTTAYLNGVIDEVQLYQRALSDEQARRIYLAAVDRKSQVLPGHRVVQNLMYDELDVAVTKCNANFWFDVNYRYRFEVKSHAQAITRTPPLTDGSIYTFIPFSEQSSWNVDGRDHGVIATMHGYWPHGYGFYETYTNSELYNTGHWGSPFADDDWPNAGPTFEHPSGVITLTGAHNSGGRPFSGLTSDHAYMFQAINDDGYTALKVYKVTQGGGNAQRSWVGELQRKDGKPVSEVMLDRRFDRYWLVLHDGGSSYEVYSASIFDLFDPQTGALRLDRFSLVNTGNAWASSAAFVQTLPDAEGRDWWVLSYDNDGGDTTMGTDFVHASPVALDGNGALSIGNPAFRMAVGLNNPTNFPFENPNYLAGGGHYVLRSGHLQMLSVAHWANWNAEDSAYRLAIDQCASPGAGAW